ncbi:CHAT domain-containing protein [Lentzea sp. NPDC005914]|uniref:CHAT domain-containing protein n=1 Tax=Lentzea sp. NPDC005914 TaxID=3154572 RepID=UPI0033D48E3B
MPDLVIASRGGGHVVLTTAAGEVVVPFRNPCTPEHAEALRWLLEACPEPAVGPDHRRRTEAEAVVEALGKALQVPLPDVERPVVHVVSDEVGFLGLPWELLHPEAEWMRRRASPRPTAVRGPVAGPLRVLLISPRPYGPEDVRAGTVSGPLLRAAGLTRGNVQVDLLRPATSERLREALADDYDILHFDGHGFAGDANCGLVFEDADGKEHRVSAHEFASFSGQVPLVVLNACRSAYHPVPGETTSVASALLDRGTPAVLAMTHSVAPRVVARFITAFYDALTDGSTLAAAVARGRRALLTARSGLPFHVIPVLYEQQPVDLRFHDAVPRADRSRDQEPVWVRPLLHQDGELADIDRQLHQGNPVVVHAPVAGGKTVLLQAYAQYALLSRGFDRVALASGAQVADLRFDGDSDERVLHVWDDIDQHVDQCAAAIRKLPSQHRVLMSSCYDSFPLPHHSHATGDLPDDLVGQAVGELVSELMDGPQLSLNEAEFKWLIRSTGWHPGTLAALLRAWRRLPLVEVPRRLDVGYPQGDDDPLLDPSVTRLLAGLSPPLRTALPFIGLYGYEFGPAELAIMTDGGLAGDTFGELADLHITPGEWRDLLAQAHRAGVVRPVLDAELGYRVSPVVSYALRGELARRFTRDQLRRLQRSAASSILVILEHAFPAPASGHPYWTRVTREFLTAVVDSHVWITTLRAIDDRNYALATSLVTAYQKGKPEGSPGWWTATEVVTHIAGLSYEQLQADPDATGLLLTLRHITASAAMARSDWKQARNQVEHMLDHRDNPHLRLDLVRLLLWRSQIALKMGRPDEVRTALAEAVRQARDSAELDRCEAVLHEAVRELELPPTEAAGLAHELGLVLEPPSGGEDTWSTEELVTEAREALLDNRFTRAAELQRILGTTARERGDFDQAREWLTAAFELERARPGIGDPARTAMHLAVLEEETDNLDDAASWCRFVLELPSAHDLLTANAHYELAIVETKRGNDDGALHALSAARELYVELGMMLYALDADALVARLLHRKADLSGASQLGESVVLRLVELKSDERAAQALMALVECWLDIGGAKEARRRFTRLLPLDQLSPGLMSAFVTRMRERLAD